MADTMEKVESSPKKKAEGGKNKQEGKMKEGKKSGGKKSPKKNVPPAEASENDTSKSMEITDLDPEGAIGDENVDNSTHDKLLNSIYAMDGRKRSVSQVRGSGMASSNVDLLVHSKIESTKIQATELNLKKKKTQLVPKPLTVFETEKAKRHIARDVMEKDTKKWEPIVNEIRVAPQIKYAERPKGVEMYKAMKPHKFSPRTPLEIELYEALGKSDDVITPDNPLTKAEEKALKAMSLKEAMARRKELLMHNELLFRSQKEGKRQNKIKSKRYRRGIRMEKNAKTKKTLEEMEKTDPEAFLEKLDKVDEARMEERLTLRHKSGGKFARYHKAFAKYDDSAREAMEEMARKGKELTQKRQIESSSEDEEEEEMNVVDAFVSNAVSYEGDDSNKSKKTTSDLNSKHLEIMKSISKKAGGWLDGTSRPSLQNKDTEKDIELSTPEASQAKDNKQKKRKRGDSEDSDESEKDISDLKADGGSQKKRKVDESNEIEDTVVENSSRKLEAIQEDEENSSPEKSKKKKRKVVDSEKIEEAIRKIRQRIAPPSDKAEQEGDSSPEKPSKKKKKNNETKTADGDVETYVTNDKKKGKDEATVITPSGRGLVDEKEDDDEEAEEKPVTMEELFEDEDVIEQFAKDKAEEEEKRKPKKEEDVKLPGWGSWSGPDFKAAPKRRQPERRRKFQRREKKVVDPNANLWLNPGRDKAIRELQPKNVPFPYVNAEQYAAAIRQPVSRGFVREVAHKILVKPETVTKLGHIIKPLDKEDFFKDKNALDVDDSFGKEIKYTGHVNYKARDQRLRTKTN